MGQNRESYQYLIIRGIKLNLIELSSCVDKMKIQCPAQKGIYENEMAD